jgi:hypothetical protein
VTDILFHSTLAKHTLPLIPHRHARVAPPPLPPLPLLRLSSFLLPPSLYSPHLSLFFFPHTTFCTRFTSHTCRPEFFLFFFSFLFSAFYFWQLRHVFPMRPLHPPFGCVPPLLGSRRFPPDDARSAQTMNLKNGRSQLLVLRFTRWIGEPSLLVALLFAVCTAESSIVCIPCVQYPPHARLYTHHTHPRLHTYLLQSTARGAVESIL